MRASTSLFALTIQIMSCNFKRFYFHCLSWWTWLSVVYGSDVMRSNHWVTLRDLLYERKFVTFWPIKCAFTASTRLTGTTLHYLVLHFEVMLNQKNASMMISFHLRHCKYKSVNRALTIIILHSLFTLHGYASTASQQITRYFYRWHKYLFIVEMSAFHLLIGLL